MRPGLPRRGTPSCGQRTDELDLGTALASWLDLTAWRLAAVLLAIALALFPERRPTSIVSRVLVIGLVADGVVVVGVTALTPGPLDAGTYQDNPFGVSWLDVATWVSAGRNDVLGADRTRGRLRGAALLSARRPVHVGNCAGRRRPPPCYWSGWWSLFLGFNGGIVLQVVPFLISVVALPVGDGRRDPGRPPLRHRRHHQPARGLPAAGRHHHDRLRRHRRAVQLLFLGEEPPSSLVTISALVLVSLIALPARDRLQRLADRIVFGRRSTPYHALATFAEMSAGAWSLQDTAPRLAGLLADATGASSRRRLRPGGRPTAAGEPRTGPADRPRAGGGDRFGCAHWPGSTWRPGSSAAVNCSARWRSRLPPGRPVRPAERRLIGQLAAQAALVFETLRLTSELTRHAEALAEQAVELRRSRLRLVRAQDAERNRIGRDLHDGSQQHLVAIIAKAGLARSQLNRDPQLADGTLAGLQQDTKAALTEIRELVHGVFPPILADRGLVVAVEQRSARLPIPVRVDTQRADVGLRMDPSVESAAWFVISEALTNAIKHSEAELITVRIRTGDRLTVQVSDDGVGMAGPTTGHGVTGMRDRVATLGGELTFGAGRRRRDRGGLLDPAACRRAGGRRARRPRAGRSGCG